MTFTAAWLGWPVPTVRLVSDTRGVEIACAPAKMGAELRLTYVHSIYREPAAEEFRVRADGLALVRLRSVSVPVLEYYARPESIRSVGGDYVVDVPNERHGSLPVLVSALGQRTVHYDGRVWPLHELAADGERVRLTVEPAARMCSLWPKARPR